MCKSAHWIALTEFRWQKFQTEKRVNEDLLIKQYLLFSLPHLFSASTRLRKSCSVDRICNYPSRSQSLKLIYVRGWLRFRPELKFVQPTKRQRKIWPTEFWDLQVRFQKRELLLGSCSIYLLCVRILQVPIYKSQFAKSVTSSFRDLRKTHQILCKEVKTLSTLLYTR